MAQYSWYALASLTLFSPFVRLTLIILLCVAAANHSPVLHLLADSPDNPPALADAVHPGGWSSGADVTVRRGGAALLLGSQPSSTVSSTLRTAGWAVYARRCHAKDLAPGPHLVRTAGRRRVALRVSDREGSHDRW